ncbi:hypothetical protein Tco_1045939 [Tanacetum coccineum]
MIGCLMYLTASRPDIMFVVCLCARFQVTPKVSHLHAVKRIFRYLKHQPKLGLWYPKDSPFHLEAFSDSDYAGDNHDRRSTSGGCQYLGRRLVSWQCKKQTIVAISSTEAEYVAAASCSPFAIVESVFHSKPSISMSTSLHFQIAMTKGLNNASQEGSHTLAAGGKNRVLVLILRGMQVHKGCLKALISKSAQSQSLLIPTYCFSNNVLLVPSMRTVNSQGTAELQRTADIPSTAEPHDAAFYS